MQTQVAVDPMVQNGIQAILNLDLTNVIGKLKQPTPRGRGWSDSQAADADKWYRRFLILVVKNPGVAIAPTQMVDEIWHLHLLHTRQYTEDTRRIFGRFLHHQPTDENGLSCNVKMREMCMAEFGEVPRHQSATENSDCDQGCSGGDCNSACSME